MNYCLYKLMIAWLVGWLPDLLNDCLTAEYLSDWMISTWLPDWLSDWLMHWLSGWTIIWLACLLIEHFCLIYWLGARLFVSDQLNDYWLIDVLSGWLTVHWVTEMAYWLPASFTDWLIGFQKGSFSRKSMDTLLFRTLLLFVECKICHNHYQVSP
jgi:hypothetical protein